MPHPHGELSKVLSTSAIEEANKEVKDVLVREKGSRRLIAILESNTWKESNYW